MSLERDGMPLSEKPIIRPPAEDTDRSE